MRDSKRVALLKLAMQEAVKPSEPPRQKRLPAYPLKRCRDGYLLQLDVFEDPLDWLRRLGAMEARQGWAVPPGSLCVSRVHEIRMLVIVNPLKMGWRHVARPLYFIRQDEWREVYEHVDAVARIKHSHYLQVQAEGLRWYGEYAGVEWL